MKHDVIGQPVCDQNIHGAFYAQCRVCDTSLNLGDARHWGDCPGWAPEYALGYCPGPPKEKTPTADTWDQFYSEAKRRLKLAKWATKEDIKRVEKEVSVLREALGDAVRMMDARCSIVERESRFTKVPVPDTARLDKLEEGLREAVRALWHQRACYGALDRGDWKMGEYHRTTMHAGVQRLKDLGFWPEDS